MTFVKINYFGQKTENGTGLKSSTRQNGTHHKVALLSVHAPTAGSTQPGASSRGRAFSRAARHGERRRRWRLLHVGRRGRLLLRQGEFASGPGPELVGSGSGQGQGQGQGPRVRVLGFGF